MIHAGLMLAAAAPSAFARAHELPVRESSAAGIAVAAAIANADELRSGEAEAIEFEIGLDTHFGDLFQFRLEELAEVVVDGEHRLDGAFEWAGGRETSHHRNGRLLLRPANRNELAQLLTAGAQLELRLKEIGTEVRTFRWEL